MLKRNFILSLLLLLVLSLCACNDDNNNPIFSDKAGDTFQGDENCINKAIIYVIDSLTNQPVKNVRVELYGGCMVPDYFKMLTTDTEGKVVFENLCNDAYRVHILNNSSLQGECSWFQIKLYDTTLDGSDTFDTVWEFTKYVTCFANDVVAICNDNKIVVNILDSASNRGIEYTTVFLYRTGFVDSDNHPSPLMTLTTNENGQVVFENLRNGNYHYIARSGTARFDSGIIHISCQQTETFTYYFNEKIYCEFIFDLMFYRNEQPLLSNIIEGVKVTITQQSTDRKVELISDNFMGRVVFDRYNEIGEEWFFEKGIYIIEYEKENFVSGRFEVEMNCSNQIFREYVFLKDL